MTAPVSRSVLLAAQAGDYPWVGEEPELVLVQGRAADMLVAAGLGVGGARTDTNEGRVAATMAPVWLEQVAGFLAQWVDDRHGRGSGAWRYQERAVLALKLARYDEQVRREVQTLVHLSSPGKAAVWLLGRLNERAT